MLRLLSPPLRLNRLKLFRRARFRRYLRMFFNALRQEEPVERRIFLRDEVALTDGN